MDSKPNSPTDTHTHRPSPHRWIATFVLAASTLASPAQGQTAEEGKKRAIGYSMAARAELDARRPDQATELYRKAYEADPSEPGYLYSVARAEQAAGRLDDAERDFLAFLKVAAAAHALTSKAKDSLIEVRGQLAEQLKKRLAVGPAGEPTPTAASAPALPAPTPPPAAGVIGRDAPAPPADTSTWRRPAGWATLALGIVGGGAGAGWLAQLSGDVATFNASQPPAGTEFVKKTGCQDASACAAAAARERDELDGNITTAYVVTGAGAAIAAAGAVLLWTAPAAATPAVTWNGRDAALTVAWRF
jgi:hypothetical protein